MSLRISKSESILIDIIYIYILHIRVYIIQNSHLSVKIHKLIIRFSILTITVR